MTYHGVVEDILISWFLQRLDTEFSLVLSDFGEDSLKFWPFLYVVV
jgi:hypothetical protein